MSGQFQTPIFVIEETKQSKWSASFQPNLQQVVVDATAKETASQRAAEDAEIAALKKEQEAEKAFLDKWDPRTPQTRTSDYWHRTPSRLYWALSYNHFEDQPEKQLEMAKDLLAIYGDSANPKNTSLAHAMDFVKQHG
jgi:hypothetical protein